MSAPRHHDITRETPIRNQTENQMAPWMGGGGRSLPSHGATSDTSCDQLATDHSAMFQNACVTTGFGTYPSMPAVAEIVLGE